MNFKNLIVAVLAAGGLLFSACSNDIDLTAEFKETAVIYGLLNPLDTVHYIRIQKAFLGDGNALVMSQNPDSVYYPDILDVQLQRIKNGVNISSFSLSRFVGPQKEPGTFPVTPNILYKTNGETIFRDSEYKLIVTNTQSGSVFTAQTPIVDTMRIVRPAVNNFNTITFATTAPYKVEFAQANNARVYNLTVRFHYDEENIATAVITPKYIDWEFPNRLVTNPQNITAIEFPIYGEDFYKYVGQKLKVDPAVRRYAGNLDFFFIAGAEFLSNYITINQATTSILTSIPQYSNINGGTGVFSSRIKQASLDKPLSIPSKDLLITSPYTSALGFQ
jgi:hypothetical protein